MKKKVILLLILLIVLSNTIFTQDYEYDKNTGHRAITFNSMPIDWFELEYRNYSNTEVFEYSILPLIEINNLNNQKIIDNINPQNRVKLNEITQQLINATYGTIKIKRFEFFNIDNLKQYRNYIFKNPHLFKNVFFEDKLMYDIEYDSKSDFETLRKILKLDNIESKKLTLGHYPLPFAFVYENDIDVSNQPEFLKSMSIIKAIEQKFIYNDNIISVLYYMLDDFSITSFRDIIESYPQEQFLISENVIIQTSGDFSPVIIDFPVGIILRNEKIDD